MQDIKKMALSSDRSDPAIQVQKQQLGGSSATASSQQLSRRLLADESESQLATSFQEVKQLLKNAEMDDRRIKNLSVSVRHALPNISRKAIKDRFFKN